MDKIANFVGSIPEHYDRGLGPVIFVDYADDMAKRVAALQPDRVLEIAAGTGIVTRRLRDQLPAGAELTATDLNPPMLEVARQKLAAGEQVTFRQADALALPFPDASFDVVVCQFGVMFYPDKDKSFREALRVLRPGGHYLFSIWDAHEYNSFGRITHELAERFFPVDPPQFLRIPYSYTFEEAKRSALAAGFDDFTAAVERRIKEVPDFEPFARGLVFGNPFIEQVRARGGVDPEAIVTALVAALRAEFGADPGRVPLQTIMFSARKPR
jgi:ubiquinone/menaquinone biosynthesis C-methylase UbiE